MQLKFHYIAGILTSYNNHIQSHLAPDTHIYGYLNIMPIIGKKWFCFKKYSFICKYSNSNTSVNHYFSSIDLQYTSNQISMYRPLDLGWLWFGTTQSTCDIYTGLKRFTVQLLNMNFCTFKEIWIIMYLHISIFFSGVNARFCRNTKQEMPFLITSAARKWIRVIRFKQVLDQVNK